MRTIDRNGVICTIVRRSVKKMRSIFSISHRFRAAHIVRGMSHPARDGVEMPADEIDFASLPVDSMPLTGY